MKTTKMIVMFILLIVLFRTASANLPKGWSGMDLDNASYDSHTWYVKSDPGFINSVYTNVSGDDVEIIARVVSVYNTDVDSDAQAIVMLREDPTELNPAQANVFIQRSTVWSQGYSVSFSDKVAEIENLPYWVRLKREGNIFTCYISSDGSNWALLGRSEIVMSTNPQFHLSVINNAPTSFGTPLTYAEAQFDYR